MKRVSTVIAALATASALCAQQDWQNILQDYLKTDSNEEAKKHLTALQSLQPSQLLDALKKGLTYLQKESGWIEFEAAGMPATLYIPPKYDPTKPAPILFFLHGGINRPRFVPLQHLKKYIAYYWKETADKNGWFLCAPASKRGLMWWQTSGTRALEEVLRYIKRRFNIDETRIWVAGFSDGGSGAFHLAAHAPTHFSILIPLNGNPLVPDRYGAPMFLENFKNRLIYAVHTKNDSLYPAAVMKPIMNAAKKAGANLIHRILPGTHSPSYLTTEVKKIVPFLKQHPLSIPTTITWFVTDTKNYGRCDWLVVTSLKKGIGARPSSQNLTVKPRKILGVRIDPRFAGAGAKVDGVQKNSAAEKAGIKPGDIITKINNKDITSLQDLRNAIKALKRGKPFTITVKRAQQSLTLNATLPNPKPEPIFTRPKLWGAVTASFNKQNNTLNIDSYNVNKITILLTWPLFEPEKPLQITVNGKTRYNNTPKPDVTTILKYARIDMNRKAIVWGKIEITVPAEERASTKQGDKNKDEQ